MPAWRCPNCLTNWPSATSAEQNTLFDKCPDPMCDSADTEAIRNASPDLPVEESISRAKTLIFEGKYDDWEKKQDPKRLVPTADERVKYPFRPELGNRQTYGDRHGIKAVERKGLLGTRKS
jgi:hypothetical protein